MQLDEIKTQLRSQLPALAERFEVESLGIFGSWIRHEERPDSDLDLLITLKKPIDLFRFMDLEHHLSDLLGVKVDLVMKSALKPRIGERILSEVEIL